MPHRLVMAVMLWLFANPSSTRPAHELWKFKLTGEGGIHRFDRPQGLIWLAQQGVVFLSSDRLLIYQVNRRRDPAPLAPRSVSGGGGNFALLARVFDVKTGVEIRHVQFLTSADYSSIVPTHDGKFIVRAGAMLALYDPDFHPLVARKLPLASQAPIDYWQISVTPSGKQVALVHQQRFGELRPDTKIFTPGKSEADVEILNADTFQVIKTLHLPYYLPVWSAQEQFLLTTAPQKPLTDTEFGAVAGGSHYIAIRTDEYAMAPFGMSGSQPVRIELYDLQSWERVASVKVQKAVVDYALSSEGLLAVVDGDEVRLYQPD
ncbi:MAG TPA: hypothetical protein VI685_05635 [Candidatus Angelobacter sp.]